MWKQTQTRSSSRAASGSWFDFQLLLLILLRLPLRVEMFQRKHELSLLSWASSDSLLVFARWGEVSPGQTGLKRTVWFAKLLFSADEVWICFRVYVRHMHPEALAQVCTNITLWCCGGKQASTMAVCLAPGHTIFPLLIFPSQNTWYWPWMGYLHQNAYGSVLVLVFKLESLKCTEMSPARQLPDRCIEWSGFVCSPMCGP